MAPIVEKITVKINRKDLPSKTDNPALDYCRQLLKDGYPAKTRLEIYRHADYWDYAISSIGEGAKWVIDNNLPREYRVKHLKGSTASGIASQESLNG